MLEIQRHQLQRIKLITLGMRGVGKTAIIDRFINNQFSEEHLPSIQCTLPKGHHVQFQIWDISHMEGGRSLPPIYFRDAKIALCIYDISLRESFDNMKHWVKEAISLGRQDIVLVIVGNKYDTESRLVTQAEGMEYARQMGALFKLVSAKSNLRIIDLFVQAGEEALKIPNPTKLSLPCLKTKQIDRRASCW